MWHRLVPGLVLGAALAGCGFRSSPASGGGADAGFGDGAIDGSGAGDGSSATPDCWAHWMDGTVAIDASTVKEIMELSSTGHDLEPWISSDGLRMYFLRDLTPPGHGDFYLADRGSPTGTCGEATAVMPLNTPGQEGRAWLTSDELTIALSTTHDGPLGINMTTRGAGQPFNTPGNGHMAMVNAKGTMRFDPFLTEDLQRLYFSANTGPGGKLQLWIATRTAAGDDFGPPALIPGINDNNVNELAPALYQGEQLLVFSSFPNNTPADLFYATRSSATGNFGPAAQVPQIPTVNTPAFSEIDPVLSADGCELYFASDRDTDRRFHLFHAQITR